MNESRLQHYPHCARGNPSHRECLAAFQDWIAHIRTKSLDVSANEKLRCPMLWCRDSFEDDISAVRHAADCSWLRDSWYWCPRCGRPESFFGDGHSPPAIPRTNSKVKEQCRSSRNSDGEDLQGELTHHPLHHRRRLKTLHACPLDSTKKARWMEHQHGLR